MSDLVAKYRISWKNRETGFQSCGEYCFNSLEDINSTIEALNNQHPEIDHWADMKYSKDHSDSPPAKRLVENSSESTIGQPK